MDILPFDLQLFVQTLLYIALIFAGLTSAAPQGILFNLHGNKCFLFGTATWWKNGTDFDFAFGNSSSCNFAIYSIVICSVFVPIGMALYYGYATYKSRTDNAIAASMWVMPFILGASLISVLMFITAIVSSIGFSEMCSTYYNPFSKSCIQIEKKYTNAYTFTRVSEVAAWFVTLFWVTQLALLGLRVIRNRRLRSEDNFSPEPNAPDTTQIGHVDPTA